MDTSVSIHYDEKNTNLIYVCFVDTKSLDLETCNVNGFRVLKLVKTFVESYN